MQTIWNIKYLSNKWVQNNINQNQYVRLKMQCTICVCWHISASVVSTATRLCIVYCALAHKALKVNWRVAAAAGHTQSSNVGRKMGRAQQSVVFRRIYSLSTSKVQRTVASNFDFSWNVCTSCKLFCVVWLTAWHTHTQTNTHRMWHSKDCTLSVCLTIVPM